MAWNPLIFSCHPSLSTIAVSSSFTLHLVSPKIWCIQVFISWLVMVCLYVGVHKRLSLWFLPECLFVLFRWFVRREVSCRTAAVLWVVTCRNFIINIFHELWASEYSSTTQGVFFEWWELRGCTAIFFDVTSRLYLKEFVAFLCSS